MNSTCSITYYYSSPTSFGHSCDHHQCLTTRIQFIYQ